MFRSWMRVRFRGALWRGGLCGGVFTLRRMGEICFGRNRLGLEFYCFWSIRLGRCAEFAGGIRCRSCLRLRSTPSATTSATSAPATSAGTVLFPVLGAFRRVRSLANRLSFTGRTRCGVFPACLRLGAGCPTCAIGVAAIGMTAIGTSLPARLARRQGDILFTVFLFLCEVGDVQKSIPLQADIDEGRLHAGKHTGNFAFVNGSGEGIFVLS